jgi:DNA mismatch repair protein MutL
MNNRSSLIMISLPWGACAMPIRQLAPDVAAKIAAGEVVERPASVVKELIENSIDAGATQIRIDLMHGGLQLIRVTDNGCGIPAEELPLALARHATSKVAQIDDLEHIRSLGFRGEALASIAAVADVTLVSRARGAAQGAQISASNGQLSEVTAAASPEGTTLTVRNLFSVVPARLKFLKSRNTEVSHCHHLLEQYALAYPEIRFTVYSEGRQIFATPGDGKLFSVLVEIYGLQVAEQMVPLTATEHADDPASPVVTGYTSRPTCYKSTRQYMSFFVNRRWVLSRILTAAVEGAYHSLLLTGRHPIVVVNIELDPTLLDVNVHPAKTEIRFLKERRVFGAVLRAIRRALLEEPQMPRWQPSSRAQQATTSTEADDDILGDILSEEIVSSREQKTVMPAEDDEIDTFPRDNPWLTVTEEETGTKPPLTTRLWQSHVRRPDAQRADQTPAGRDEPRRDLPHEESSLPFQTLPLVEAKPSTSPSPEVRSSPSAPTGNLLSAASSSPVTPLQSSAGAITIPEADTQHLRRLPRLRVVGQLSQSYIVTEGDDGMYLIDQHAAHERILLERMVAALKTHMPLSQHLLTPIRLELSPQELEALEDHQQQLEHIGFVLESGDDGTAAVLAVPDVLAKRMNVQSLHELLLELTALENLGHTETWEERALANVACKAAIKAHYFLTVSEMRELLEQLEQTQAPYSCCHGRPTMVHFSLSALEREFGRR